MSTFDPAVVAALRKNGMRLGVVGTSPPHALQAALDMTSETSPDDKSQSRIVGQRFTRRSGEEFEVETWSGYPACSVHYASPKDTEVREYGDARCLFRVNLERLQDGWARLDLVPEIHHGEMKLRKFASDFAFTQRPSQQIVPFFDQRFQVDLNLGEMVIIGADGDDPRSLGHHFFRGGDSDSHMERLLVIRLADMQRIDPL